MNAFGPRKSIEAPCPLCGKSVVWARSSKGWPEEVEPDPTGHIYVEQGFTHVYDDNEAAVNDLLAQQFPFELIEERLHNAHFCALTERTDMRDVTPCPTCLGERVVLHAGSMETDEGFMEIRKCPTCSTGERLGRSDVPICTEQLEAAAGEAERHG